MSMREVYRSFERCNSSRKFDMQPSGRCERCLKGVSVDGLWADVKVLGEV